MVVFGVVGWLFEENRIPVAPALLGIVLGGMLEFNFVTSMLKSDGSLLIFFDRPIALLLALFVALVWSWPMLKLLRRNS